MGVIFTNHIPDHTGRFLIRFVPVVAQLVHGEQNPPVHWLKTVTDVGQRTPNNDAHGIIKVGAFQLVLDIDRHNFFGQIAHLVRPFKEVFQQRESLYHIDRS